jgi:asparagine synthase (glutamine-hydrolysing)
MVRYMALLWDATDASSTTTAQVLTQRLLANSGSWQSVLSKTGFSILVSKGAFACYAPHSLGDSGAVLGVVFDRNNPARNSARTLSPFFGDVESEKIVRSGGHHLVENYWGRYIAFFSDPSGTCKKVLRDPLGDILCYHARVHGIDIYFSCLPDFLKLRALPLSVNWSHLGLRVISGNGWAEESALNEIECVRPGECIEHKGTEVSRKHCWHPFAIANRPAIEQHDTAAAQVRSTAQACASAWATLHTDAIQVLSGGLDSSIVLSCIAAAPNRPRMACMNFRTRDPDSDERVYARLIAAHSGTELAEIERQPTLDFEGLSKSTPIVGPVCTVMRGLEVQPWVTQFAQSRGATAVFSGDGGDLLFFRGWPQLAVIDYAHCHGLRPELMRQALGAAFPAQLSVGRLLVDALKYGVLGRPWSLTPIIFDHYRLITDDVAHTARQVDFLNPWNTTIGSLPPGKLLHAFSVSRPCLFRDPLASTPTLDFINPLMSQPLVELSLQIPTWLHAAYGKDRAIARTAFASDLPPQVVQRTWKGAADRHLRDMLVNNITKIREFLLEGELIKGGILDRKRLRGALSLAPTRGGSHVTEIFGYLSTEAWLQQAREWQATTPLV